MIELSDRNLLELFDRYGQTGLKIDGQQYKKGEGETPKAFIDRVKGAHYAWRASQEAAKASEAGSNPSVRGTRDNRSRAGSGSGKSAVQKVEGGLEAAIQAQISDLSERKKQLEAEIKQLDDSLVHTRQEYNKVTNDLTLAERFLNTMKNGQPSDEG